MKFDIRPAANPTSEKDRMAKLVDPGFGRVFTDHMAIVRYNQAKGGWYEARIEARANFQIDPAGMPFKLNASVACRNHRRSRSIFPHRLGQKSEDKADSFWIDGSSPVRIPVLRQIEQIDQRGQKRRSAGNRHDWNTVANGERNQAISGIGDARCARVGNQRH